MKQKLITRNIKTLSPQKAPYEVRDTEIKGFLLRVQPSGAMSYYFDYRTNGGVRKRYRIGGEGNLSPTQARDIAEELSADVSKGTDIQAVRKNAKQEGELAKRRTLEAFLDNEYFEIAAHEHSAKTDTIERVRRNFESFLTEPMDTISPLAVQRWRSKRLKAGRAKSTINRDMSALRSVLSKAVELGIIAHHPLPAHQLKPLKTDSENSKPRFLSAKEEKRLRGALDDREKRIRVERASHNSWLAERGKPLLPDLWRIGYADYLKPMVLLALNTGTRRGELFHLTWNDVELRQRNLTIEGRTAKSGKTRHIPLNDEATQVLKTWSEQSDDSGVVFPSATGKPFDNIQTSWERVRNEAKLADFRFHDLRHTFASNLVMHGVPLNTVRELLGHSEINMTLRYSHLAPDHKADAVRKLDER